jgi:hypothetical protein
MYKSYQKLGCTQIELTEEQSRDRNSVVAPLSAD